MKSAVHLAVILLNKFDPIKHKNSFFIKKNGIGVQLHYIPVHTQPYYKKLGLISNAEIYAKSAISIPLYPGLSANDQEYIFKNYTRLSIYINIIN